jgi:hypothetical protein
MGRKQRGHRRRYNGISRRGVWLLTGILLGYCIPHTPKERRKAFIIAKDGKITKICRNAVDALVAQGMMYIDNNKNAYTFTGNGFDVAAKRLRRVNIPIVNRKMTMPQKYAVESVLANHNKPICQKHTKN